MLGENLSETPKRSVLSEVTNSLYVSPTANLKLLTTVALQYTYQRKEKSLQILCDRFLELYPLHDHAPDVEIQLDATARELGVEKRRIYDIINILEALQCATHRKKNTYTWHGASRLSQFLVDLKNRGEYLNGRKGSLAPPKRRSLGNLAQRFLMMFLVKPPNSYINLDMAVDVLIRRPQNPTTLGSVECDRTDRQLKSKVRRLYDIANVLSSIGLIEKVSNSILKKPVFRYVGLKYVRTTPISSTMLTPDSINVGRSITYPTANRSKRKLEFSSLPASPRRDAPSYRWNNLVQVADMELSRLNNTI